MLSLPTFHCRLNRLALAWLLIALAGCAAHPPSDNVTLYLLRHGETVSATVNPDRPLNRTGQQRAQWLSEYFAERKLGHLYSTDITRTLQTLAPTAQQTGLPVTHYDPRQLEQLAAELRQLGASALVAGHSNTTPALLNALLGEQIHGQIDDAEHSLIFVLQMNQGQVQSMDIQHSKP